jgi:DNA topoisomerase III
MKLYIAEKPSLGRAVADVLPKPHKKEDGFIRVGNGDIVSWCIGHLLEQAEPQAYDPSYKQWKIEHLPIIPNQWKLEPKPGTKKQLTQLKKLIKQADELIHTGDPDREGQLLVDEVISHAGVSGAKRNAVKRCLISDLNPNAVRKALERLQNNRDFIPLSTSALARSRADWLYGINMTRLCTLQGQKTGFNGVLSVGRVQTPLLGLVVRRDQEIEAFVPKPYFEVLAVLKTTKDEIFKAKWQPSEACQPYQDEDGRVLSKKLAENVISRISGRSGVVKATHKKTKKQAAALPYSLSSLQIDAAKRFGVSAKEVLDTCQSLYEKHKLITYPRSDCRYLPDEHWGQAGVITAAIGSVCAGMREAVAAADLSLRSKAWNDKKVDAHHAIIPTERRLDASRLNRREQQIYELIARQYLAQFYTPWVYDDRQVDVEIEGGLFIAKSRQTMDQGWKVLFKQPENKNKEDDSSIQATLPNLKKGERLHCMKGELLEKMTSPPKYFTDATLLSAMTGIARFVVDSNIKKILKETDGLGTEATRAGIIELLFKRDFLLRQGKQIRATDTGRQLINSLPDIATTPDMTAQWESQLEAISQSEASYNSFIEPMQASLNPLITQIDPMSFRGLKNSPQKKRKKYKRRKAA